MHLSVTFTGLLDKVVVSSLPRAFVKRIFTHCMGKNNTPYFANNCFKGVLYFNDDLAMKFGEDTGHTWKGWEGECRFYHQDGFVFETNLEAAALVDGKREFRLEPASLATRSTPISLDAFLPKIGPEEVIVLLGSVDKAEQTYTVEVEGDSFDPEKLLVSLDDFEEFAFDDRLLTGLSYNGAEMAGGAVQSRGMNMIMPALFDHQGGALDLYDFVD
ncbi:MAG: hypothetical protein AB1916_00255 [Thermodesulfobacteriota bacterium]